MKRHGLAYLRANLGMAQHELAKELGLKQQAIARWETGRSYPSLKQVAKMAEIFDCDFLTVARCFVEIKR